MAETTTWYLTDWTEKVMPVEVERETDASVYVRGYFGRVERAAKVATHHVYHRTEAEAATYLIQRQLGRIDAAKRDRHTAESRLGELRKRYPEAYKAVTAAPEPGH